MQKRGFFMGLILFGFSLFPFQVNSEAILGAPLFIAQRMRVPNVYIITIQGNFNEGNVFTWIEPRELRVGRGDTVTWVNESQVEVRMRFGQGRPCEKVSVKALGWKIGPDKCYETEDTLSPRETANIRFRDIGRYHFEVEFVGKDRSMKGSIFVRTEDR